jgi:hypothetical protein
MRPLADGRQVAGSRDGPTAVLISNSREEAKVLPFVPAERIMQTGDNRLVQVGRFHFARPARTGSFRIEWNMVTLHARIIQTGNNRFGIRLPISCRAVCT